MAIFGTTLNQMGFLFSFILIGYILSKAKLVPENAQVTLSKLENYIFIPALVLGTFIDHFTVATLSTTWQLLLSSLAFAAVVIAISVPLVRLCSKSSYERNIFLYGLVFSNFGFVGNAIVNAVFPDVFMQYIIFTLPLWTLIYLWGAPVLLMGDNSQKTTLAQRLKSFLNPMVICMLIGMVIGILNVKLPAFVGSAVSAAGSCMSPVAMLLTGMTLGKCDLKKVLGIKSIYFVTFLRLIVYPVLFLGVIYFLKKTGLFLPEQVFCICALNALAMPLGLNTIVIPGAYGKDTTVATGMVLVSHIFGCITIPLIFALYQAM